MSKIDGIVAVAANRLAPFATTVTTRILESKDSAMGADEAALAAARSWAVTAQPYLGAVLFVMTPVARPGLATFLVVLGGFFALSPSPLGVSVFGTMAPNPLL